MVAHSSIASKFDNKRMTRLMPSASTDRERGAAIVGLFDTTVLFFYCDWLRHIRGDLLCVFEASA